MRHLLLATLAAVSFVLPAAAEQRFEARLAGHAILPAATFTAPPQGAPPGFAVSGRFAGPTTNRVAQPGSVMGNTGAAYGSRDTGISLPFQGQPVQGFSGIKPVGDGSYWVLTDNGFGARANSPDALLMFHRVRPDFATGQVAVERTVFLSDPNSVVPFRITTEGSRERFLTGADFDPESIQPLPDGTFYIGEEFGPYLMRVDAEGRVTHVVETRLDNDAIRSPDHPAHVVPATPTGTTAFRARRSGGYEGMALTPDGQTLWGLLEQPLFAAGTDRSEGNFLRLIEFNVARNEWTGRNLRFQLSEGATAIGDFNFIDANRALIIERDNGQGDPGLECREGQRPPACFVQPAGVKRVTLVDFSQVDANGFVRRIGYIDLMAIQDPDNRARLRGDLPANAPAGRFTFPFFTIENVAMVDADHIIVGNDNNLPFSAGRHLTRADDNELILLRVPELLRAR
ncbi:esterase-like activity of phytase family protein [Roseococcus pinisoli]|uniref:Esterase-like activity of phytase family protein n=1 Tax=Roseococcus pinisoli TaxID=2835040 RepID=A0ABS5QBG7_9PROT|nr:esterase-like activity of phytase family protein [Roseococcus pinisoli]MBS7810596.1 esterase-like activity of phytase family protein [Roseococcus pinisoli]